MSSTGSSDDHSGLHRVNTSSQHDPLPKRWIQHAQAKTLPSTVKQGLTPHPTSRQLATALYHWTTCIFISVLILSQFLGLFWNSVTSEGGALNGSYPVAGGMREIPGDNDKLVTDRVLACVLEGPYYKPVLLNDVLGTSGSTVVPETAPPQVDGYRVLRRHGATLSDDAFATYMDTCALISTTLGMILDTCDNDLGYSVTRDGLRIVVDGEKTSGSTSDTVYLIKNALPVLVMPFWDNASIARYAVPGTDGSACLFRLTGKYIDSTLTDGFPVMLAVNRSVRESLTQEWLQASNGKWRHGWLHVGNGDESETAYFSDVISSDPGSTDGLTQREFNTLTKQELNCVNNRKECITSSVSQSWGDKMLRSWISQLQHAADRAAASPQGHDRFLLDCRLYFDGEQIALSESWSTIYPGHFFAPTLALLCLLHRIRVLLASSGALSGVDGRVATEVHSAEMQELQLVDFFISDLVLVGLNLLPLVFAPYIPPVKQPDTELQGVERALAIRASNVGGLGCSPVYIYGDEKDQRTKIALNSYELVRLGYVVFGGQFLLTFDAWDVIMNTAPLHHGYAAVGDKPIVCRLDDARLDSIPFWDIAPNPSSVKRLNTMWR
ncbi:hypothetical protein GQ600_25537 [Phytophthora cactorum]|nr:hypothetical protein GQ600_25537 [Phytophthora cactorum]